MAYHGLSWLDETCIASSATLSSRTSSDLRGIIITWLSFVALALLFLFGL